jgi:hypothetical protein
MDPVNTEDPGHTEAILSGSNSPPSPLSIDTTAVPLATAHPIAILPGGGGSPEIEPVSICNPTRPTPIPTDGIRVDGALHETISDDADPNSTPETAEVNDYPLPTEPEVVLHSRSRHTRRHYRHLSVLAALSCVTNGVAIYYAYNASIATNPFVPLLWGSSNWTMATINALTQLSTLLLAMFMNAVSNNVRWSLASRPRGIPFIGFLALGPSVSLWGLIKICKSICSFTMGHKRTWLRAGRWWAIQRYFLDRGSC